MKVRLVATQKGKYVDSITATDEQTIKEFREDFCMCKIEVQG